MKKLSGLPAPALAGVVRAKTERAAKAGILNCYYRGADMIDLHLPPLADRSEEALSRIISYSPLPVLALHYLSNAIVQEAGETEEERAAVLLTAARAGAAGVDLEGHTFHAPSRTAFCGEDRYSFTKGGPKEVVTDEKIIARQCAFVEEVHATGAEVLLSCHPGIPMTAEQVVDLALFLEKRGPDIIKIVTTAKDENDLLESIRAMTLLKKEVRTPVAYHAAGHAGLLSRVINPALGGQIAFCVDGFDENSTLDQLDLTTARAVIDGLKRFKR